MGLDARGKYEIKRAKSIYKVCKAALKNFKKTASADDQTFLEKKLSEAEAILAANEGKMSVSDNDYEKMKAIGREIDGRLGKDGVIMASGLVQCGHPLVYSPIFEEAFLGAYYAG